MKKLLLFLGFIFLPLGAFAAYNQTNSSTINYTNDATTFQENINSTLVTAWNNKGTSNLTDYDININSNVTKGVTAYGWGNHAIAGYATNANVSNKGNANYSFSTNDFNGTGNMTASFFKGNGSQLTGITGSGAYVNFTTNETADITWTHNFTTNGTLSSTATGDSSFSTGVNVTGVVKALSFSGAGENLTGLPTYVNESTTATNTSTINNTKTGTDFNFSINSTLVSAWNNKGSSNETTTVTNTSSIGAVKTGTDFNFTVIPGGIASGINASNVTGTFGTLSWGASNIIVGSMLHAPLPYAITLTGVYANAIGGTNVTVRIEDCSANGTQCSRPINSTAWMITTGTQFTATSFGNATIPAGNWTNLNATAVNGSVTNLAIGGQFTK